VIHCRKSVSAELPREFHWSDKCMGTLEHSIQLGD